MVKVVVKRQIGADLGHFGPVKVGDVLLMTDHEWDCVSDDRRFSRLGGALPKQSAPEDQAEINRREKLALENDEGRVFHNELLELNRDQLLVRARAMRNKGVPIVFREPDKCRTLRKAIIEVSSQGTEAVPPVAGVPAESE